MENIKTQTMWSRVGQAVGQAWQSSKTKIVNIFPSWETIKITSASLKTRAVKFGGKAVNLLPSVVKNHPVVTISLVIAGGISTLYLLHKCTKNKMRLLEAENQKLQKQIQGSKFDLICIEDAFRSKDKELRNKDKELCGKIASLQAMHIMLQGTRHQLTETQDALDKMQSQDGSQETQTSNSSDTQETQSEAQENSLSSENENQVNIQETQNISQSDTQEIQDENQVNAQENDIQAQNEAEQPVKRGRGRPRKPNNVQNQGNIQTQPKRKPGRPRKNA